MKKVNEIWVVFFWNLRAAVGSAEVRAEHHRFGAAAQGVAHRVQRRHDALRVGDGAVLHRDVKVHPEIQNEVIKDRP